MKIQIRKQAQRTNGVRDMGFSGLAHTTKGSLVYVVVWLLTQPHRGAARLIMSQGCRNARHHWGAFQLQAERREPLPCKCSALHRSPPTWVSGVQARGAKCSPSKLPLSLGCWKKELHKSKSLITVLHLTQANPI